MNHLCHSLPSYHQTCYTHRRPLQYYSLFPSIHTSRHAPAPRVRMCMNMYLCSFVFQNWVVRIDSWCLSMVPCTSEDMRGNCCSRSFFFLFLRAALMVLVVQLMVSTKTYTSCPLCPKLLFCSRPILLLLLLLLFIVLHWWLTWIL
ncbi:hypothetical protein EDD21DRAFT_382026 [Dissophora ornata]|nr:hypothetical protein EDD21DRAFT_382026 [Dissophora ornata]